MDSILTSIKKMLGITEDYEHFDQDLIMHINSVFMILNQLGVGPEVTFRITGKDETWDQFIDGKTDLDSVKSYMYLKVKMMFDPPQSGIVTNATQEQIRELEFRLNIADDYE